MAGLADDTPIPTGIEVKLQSRVVVFHYEPQGVFELSHEFLRVFTPSAEARGHGPGQETLQVGKRDVTIERVEAVGNYAIRPVFSDGHDTGIYSWDLLYELCAHKDALWQAYLDQVEQQGLSRDPQSVATPLKPTGGCGSRNH